MRTLFAQRPYRGMVNGLRISASLLSYAAVVSCAGIGIGSNARKAVHPIPRIGFVAGAGGYPDMAITNQAFFDALAREGFRDGTTMTVVFRSAQGDMARMPELVTEVLGSNVDVLVVSSSPGCASARKATRSLPILCISVQNDPRREGFTRSLKHGSGNVVGVHSFLADGIARQLAGMDHVLPCGRGLAILYNPNNATQRQILADWQAAGSGNRKIVPMPVSEAADLDDAISAAKRAGASGALVLLGADTFAIRSEIASAGRRSGFPIAMDTPPGYLAIGGVAEIGVDIVPLYALGARKLMVPLLHRVSPDRLSWLGPTAIRVKINKNNLAKSGGRPCRAK